MPIATPESSVTFSVPEEEDDLTITERCAPVCLAIAAFAAANTALRALGFGGRGRRRPTADHHECRRYEREGQAEARNA